MKNLNDIKRSLDNIYGNADDDDSLVLSSVVALMEDLVIYLQETSESPDLLKEGK